ncbi:MAG TPA: putative sulfate exporter family transporter [Bacteroidales bacterium]|nr:putative sulfate exporter family transporter [Bacteroidales bacterium]HPB25888.1 putative sulfate exporter family transporter [Bacteroidales bacterium]
MSPPIALLIGIALSIFGIKHENIHKYTSKILQASIVLMGFGMSLSAVISASKTGFIETTISVTTVMILGVLLGKLLKVDKNTSLLIASGTAICGGSAIAAVAPILKSKSYQTSFALIVVFVLNAVALFLFPFIGNKLGLSQEMFGNWAAIAIHDTSSVVGAGAVYGEKALQVATTVKLIRALWIIPLSLVIAFTNKNDEKKSIKFPWFILLFVLAIVFANLFPGFQESYEHFNWSGKRGMVIALFLIGSNITVGEIKKTGARSFVFGIALWLLISIGSLFFLTR